MLSERERQEIEAVIPHYPNRRAVGIEALKIVQQHRGWVSDEAIKDVAAFLELSVDELEGVATFYNAIFRAPVGRHVILLCDSVSCWIMGEESLRERIASHLGIDVGATTPDGRFTLLPNVCLGACDRAPAMMIDRDLHGEVSPDAVASLLARYP